MASQNDYGGNRVHGSPGRHAVGRGSRHSMRCRDCGTLRYVLPVELRRAASPRCMACGGPLEQLEVDRKRMGLPKRIEPSRSTKLVTRRCPACGVPIRHNRDLAAHLVATLMCREYHGRERLVFPWQGAMVIPGSIIVERNDRSYKRWEVVGISTGGAMVSMGTWTTKRMAQDWIQEHLGPVELAR